jgi:hypothetical protein
MTIVANRVLVWLCLLGGLTFYQAKPATAQDSPSANPEAVPVASGSDAKQDHKSEQTNEEKAQDKEKPESSGSIVVAPLPVASPALGAGIVPVVGYIVPLQKEDKISPPSVIGVAG